MVKTQEVVDSVMSSSLLIISGKYEAPMAGVSKYSMEILIKGIQTFWLDVMVRRNR